MIHKSVKIFQGAHIIGDVKIGEQSSIWFNSILRGDIEAIHVGKFSNIQDNCVIHTSKDYPVKIGNYVSVGHAAVLHGCNIDDNCLIGINSTILNGSKIKKNSIVGAGAVVTEGKEFPEGSLIMGVPAKARRRLLEVEIENIKSNALSYSELSESRK
jgi:carbonic anhydrase/acetyltransferase-like protein (isoleucine patch superfamily)